MVRRTRHARRTRSPPTGLDEPEANLGHGSTFLEGQKWDANGNGTVSEDECKQDTDLWYPAGVDLHVYGDWDRDGRYRRQRLLSPKPLHRPVVLTAAYLREEFATTPPTTEPSRREPMSSRG